MAIDDRDLLKVLKAELEFLEKGGYRHSPTAPWRPQFIFEDSPTCMRYTIDTYYRLGTYEEVEAAVEAWLRKTIKQLEQERRQGSPSLRVAA